MREMVGESEWIRKRWAALRELSMGKGWIIQLDSRVWMERGGRCTCTCTWGAQCRVHL